MRVEQVLTTVPGSQAPSALLTFRLTALLAFYLDTVKGFVPEGASLCVAIGDCRALAQRTLFDVLKTKGCARLTASLTRVRLDSPQSGRLRFKWFNIEPRASPNEPHASPPGGFPSAFNRGSPIEPSNETVSGVHTRTVRGVFQRATLPPTRASATLPLMGLAANKSMPTLA